jgi:hypothetical protein
MFQLCSRSMFGLRAATFSWIRRFGGVIETWRLGRNTRSLHCDCDVFFESAVFRGDGTLTGVTSVMPVVMVYADGKTQGKHVGG